MIPCDCLGIFIVLSSARFSEGALLLTGRNSGNGFFGSGVRKVPAGLGFIDLSTSF
jgi:hypothetical protein